MADVTPSSIPGSVFHGIGSVVGRFVAGPQQWGYLNGLKAAVITRVSWEIPRNGFRVNGWQIERRELAAGGWTTGETRTTPTLAEAHQIARRFVGLSEQGA